MKQVGYGVKWALVASLGILAGCAGQQRQQQEDLGPVQLDQTTVLEGHNAYVTSVAISPDGARAASGSVDDTVILWDAQNGQQLALIEAHDGDVTGVAFSSDGQFLLTGGEDGVARLWDLQAGQQAAELTGHEDAISDVAFIPNTNQAVTSSWDQTVRVWNLETGEEIYRFAGFDEGVFSMDVSPNGRYLAVGDVDSIQIWDLANRQPVSEFGNVDGGVMALTFTPNGEWLLSADRGISPQMPNAAASRPSVRLWNVSAGREVSRYEGPAEATFDALAVAPSGRYAFFGSHDALRFWNVPAWEPMNIEKAGATSAAFAANGRRAISGHLDNTVRLWDVSGSLQPADMFAEATTEE